MKKKKDFKRTTKTMEVKMTETRVCSSQQTIIHVLNSGSLKSFHSQNIPLLKKQYINASWRSLNILGILFYGLKWQKLSYLVTTIRLVHEGKKKRLRIWRIPSILSLMVWIIFLFIGLFSIEALENWFKLKVWLKWRII